MQSMKVAVIIGVILSAVNTFAQEVKRNTVNQQHAWIPVTANVRLTENWGLHAEGQYRSAGPFDEMQQYLLRGGIEYFFNSSASFTGGYAYVMTYPYGEQPVKNEFKEHRAWQQVSLSHKSSRLMFNHRYRLEQRWLQKQQDDARDEYLYVNRVRYRVQANVPVNKETIEEGSIFFSLANELFINFGENVRYNIFDQNRFYSGLGYQVNNTLQLQAGYLNQLIQKGNGTDQENNHTWQLGLAWKYDLGRTN